MDMDINEDMDMDINEDMDMDEDTEKEWTWKRTWNI
jgi:hypothetical protein